MWIVDDDGDMFNTDHFCRIGLQNDCIKLYTMSSHWQDFHLSHELNEEERLTRYCDLMEKLTGERIDG
jgi:hypothetical protein